MAKEKEIKEELSTTTQISNCKVYLYILIQIHKYTYIRKYVIWQSMRLEKKIGDHLLRNYI